jgi:hypothetical protein
VRRTQDDWWQDAIFYQVYVRSFADSDGDGVGDLDGVRERLGYLDLLGVDAVWLTFDPTRDVDTDAFDRLVADAHRDGLKVMIDLADERTLRFWLDRRVDGFHVTDPDAHRLVRQVLDDPEGHRDFAIVADPSISLEEDMGRRDFTVNAMA